MIHQFITAPSAIEQLAHDILDGMVTNNRAVAKVANEAPHPDFRLTADQRSEAYFLRKRLATAIEPLANKPWAVRRAKMLRAKLSRHLRTDSRAYFAAFMRDWREAIMSEIRMLENAAARPSESYVRPCAALYGQYR